MTNWKTDPPFDTKDAVFKVTWREWKMDEKLKGIEDMFAEGMIEGSVHMIIDYLHDLSARYTRLQHDLSIHMIEERSMVEKDCSSCHYFFDNYPNYNYCPECGGGLK